MEMKMVDIVEFKGTLKVGGSGLRIGASKETAGIGENENPIIRHPITHLPYVPGSSIKGKVRSLLESKHSQATQQTGEPCSCGVCVICQLFGCGSAKKTKSPTRLVFRDCPPGDKTGKKWVETGVNSEVKMEVKINRMTGTTGRDGDKDFAPRPMERIPADSDFTFAFSLRIFEGDNLPEYYTKLAEGFDLLEKHYLGGCGSRGYGQVSLIFADGSEDGISMSKHLRNEAEKLRPKAKEA